MSPDQYAERLGEHDRQLQRALHELAQLRADLARSEADLALQRRAADAAGACFLIEIRELKARVKELQRECDSWRQGCTARTDDR